MLKSVAPRRILQGILAPDERSKSVLDVADAFRCDPHLLLLGTEVRETLQQTEVQVLEERSEQPPSVLR